MSMEKPFHSSLERVNLPFHLCKFLHSFAKPQDISVCQTDQAGATIAKNCLSLHREETPGEKDFI